MRLQKIVPHSRSRAFALAIAALLAGGVGLTTSRIQAAGSCGPLRDGDIVESQDFTPAHLMRSLLPEVPLNPGNALPPSIPAAARLPSDAVDGRPLRWAVVTASGAIYQYFSNRPVEGDVTYSDFVRDGGIQLDREPETAGEPFATFLLRELGERALSVEVGRLAGALTWADPLPNGVRTHNLYWSDGSFTYALIANQSAPAVVSLGRSIVCSTS